MSAIVSLVLPGGRGQQPFLSDLGYELQSLELQLADHNGRPYRLDLHLTHGPLNLSLLVDCKTSAELLKADQIEKYMATAPSDVVVGASILSPQPREHRADVVFFVLREVEEALSALVAACATRLPSGWGMVRVTPMRIEIAHDELSDSNLSTALTAGWDVDVERLPLERIPYEPGSERWELADVVLQTIQSMFVSRTREFAVDDVCIASNDLWPFLEADHDFIRSRVRQEIRTMRRTALRGWITKVDVGSGREERWRFVREPTGNRNVLAGFARRHQLYVALLLRGDDPRPDHFVRIDPEQLTLPIAVAES